MTRLDPSARPLALLLLALLGLCSSGCSGGAMYAATAPEPVTASVYAGDARAANIPAARPVAQASHPPAAPGRGAPRAEPAKNKTDATSPPPDSGGRPGVDTGSAKPAGAAGPQSPLLIYNANLDMAVFEATKALDRTEQIARDGGGYLVRRNDHSITVRVPAARFHGALASIMKLGEVLHRKISVEDVTAQYRDIMIRLENAEAVRDRLAGLLKKAQSVKDALEVERELARVTDGIERMKGKLKLLHELVEFSTITIRFREQTVDHVGSTVKLPFPWLQHLGLPHLLSL